MFLPTAAPNEAARNVGKGQREVGRHRLPGLSPAVTGQQCWGAVPTSCRAPGRASPPAPACLPLPLAPACLPSRSAMKGSYFRLSKLLSVNLHPSGFMHSSGPACQCAAFTLSDRPAVQWCWDISQRKCWSLGDQEPTLGGFSVTFTFPGHCHCHCQLLWT